MDNKPYKHPERGYVINDADHGTIFIGEDPPGGRQRQIEIHSASNAALKLFKDGGFEIQSQPTAKTADNILSNAQDGLLIKSNNAGKENQGIHIDAGGGSITFSAREIIFESTANDKNLVIRSAHNLSLEAGDTLRLEGSVVGIGAKTRMVVASCGPLYMFSNAGVSIVEPKISLSPANLLESIQSLAFNMFNCFKI